MKALVHYAKAPGAVELRELAVPAVRGGDVLVKVRASGLCGSDLHRYEGRMGRVFPCVIGHEFAGEVAEVGARVTAWRPGDRVVSDNTGAVCGRCHACITGDHLRCPQRLGLGSALDGGHAEYILIPEEALAPFPHCLMRIPDNIGFDEAAVLEPLCNGYHAVLQQGGLLPGESVAVLGAGPLALGCIQSARVGGAADILVVVRRRTGELHRQAARRAGATAILESDGEASVLDEVRARTGGEGVAMVVDCAGANALFTLAVDMLRSGGKLIRIGYDFRPLGHELTDMTNRNVALVGHMGYNAVSWRNVLKLAAAGMLDAGAGITHVLPLSAYEEGFHLLRERRAVKVVFHPDA